MNYYYCVYYDTLYFTNNNLDEVRITGQSTESNSPVCQIKLIEAKIMEYMMLNCEKCRRILINVNSFVKVIESLRKCSTEAPVVPPPLNPENFKRPIKCPYCIQEVDTHPYGGPGNIVIDNCVGCKVNWLDYNELNKIIRAPDRGYKRFSERYNFDYHFLPHKKPHRS